MKILDAHGLWKFLVWIRMDKSALSASRRIWIGSFFRPFLCLLQAAHSLLFAWWCEDDQCAVGQPQHGSASVDPHHTTCSQSRPRDVCTCFARCRFAGWRLASRLAALGHIPSFHGTTRDGIRAFSRHAGPALFVLVIL
jgi:hypothetical protein